MYFKGLGQSDLPLGRKMSFNRPKSVMFIVVRPKDAWASTNDKTREFQILLALPGLLLL